MLKKYFINAEDNGLLIAYIIFVVSAFGTAMYVIGYFIGEYVGRLSDRFWKKIQAARKASGK